MVSARGGNANALILRVDLMRQASFAHPLPPVGVDQRSGARGEERRKVAPLGLAEEVRLTF